MQKSPCCQRQVALHSACADPAQMTSENMVASQGNKKHSPIFRKPSASVQKKNVTKIHKIYDAFGKGPFSDKTHSRKKRPCFEEILVREHSWDDKEQ